MSIVALLLIGIFTGGLILGVPVAVAIALACLAALYHMDVNMLLLAHHMVNSVNSFTLIAVPGFILVGALMTRAGLVERLVDFSRALIGWFSGGLSIVTVLASMIFAGISGSAAADSAAVGSATIPALKREGYDHPLIAAMVAAGGSIGIIIPPSIPMIVYGVSTNTSIPGLFVGGYLPGILLGVGFMLLLWIIGRRRKYGGGERFSPSFLWRATKRAFWALLAPVVIVGGIVFAIVTPTEAGVIGVIYTLLISCLVLRSLDLKDIIEAIDETVRLTGVVMFVVATSGLLAWIMAREEIPQALVEHALGNASGTVAIILTINLLLLLLGAVMDTIAILIIALPVLVPIGIELGFDPIQFGVMVVFNLAIGMLTPPLGYCLFVSCSIAGVSIGRASIAVLPFVAVSLAVLMLVAFWPPLTLGLQSLIKW